MAMANYNYKEMSNLADFAKSATTVKSFLAYGGRTTKEMTFATWFLNRYRVVEVAERKLESYYLRKAGGTDVNFYKTRLTDVEATEGELIEGVKRSRKGLYAAMLEVNTEYRRASGKSGLPYLRTDKEKEDAAERLFLELLG